MHLALPHALDCLRPSASIPCAGFLVWIAKGAPPLTPWLVCTAEAMPGRPRAAGAAELVLLLLLLL